MNGDIEVGPFSLGQKIDDKARASVKPPHGEHLICSQPMLETK